MKKISKLIIEHFDIWSGAGFEEKVRRGRGLSTSSSAYGITKLRRMILSLAVSGRLSTQNEDEVSAYDLLEAIRLERGGVGPFDAIGVGSDSNASLPKSWCWVKFAEIAQHNSGKTLDGGRNQGNLRKYITTSNLYWGRFDFSELREMPIQDGELEKFSAKKGDLLICEGGDAGRAAVWMEDEPICFQNHIHRARFYGGINPFYIYRYFQKLSMTGEIDRYRKGVGISSMSGKSLGSIFIALPPIAEQARIVAKVDELMRLCDLMEKKGADSIQAHKYLVNQLLAMLLSQETPEDFKRFWSVISENFDFLFTTEESVGRLKKALCTLAITGKLVPQNHEEASAQDLFAKIQNFKQRAALGRKKVLNRANDDTITREGLPKNWMVCKFGDLVINRDSERIPLSAESRRAITGQYDYYGASGVIDKVNNFIFSGPLLLIGEDGANLISRSSPIAFIAHGKFWVNNHAHVLDGINVELLRYLELYMNSIDLEPYITGAAQPKMNQAKMNDIEVWLPPEAEQRRILERLDDLFKLCNQLENCIDRLNMLKCDYADALIDQALT